MLPDFDQEGNLPPGVHPATLPEIAERFGWQSELRRAQIESLQWLVGLAERAGAKRLIVNGSFVTQKLEPNDVDCLILIGEDFPQDAFAEAELLAGLPFLEIHFVQEETLDFFVNRVFSTDRRNIPKGVVEVIL